MEETRTMTQVRIPTPLRPYTGGNEYVEVGGGTVADALDDLTAQYPELKAHLYNDGKLRSFVNVFLGEEDIRYLDGVETPLDGEAQLMIIPSIAGG
jgi:molybdopterin converting factor small subunit